MLKKYPLILVYPTDETKNCRFDTVCNCIVSAAAQKSSLFSSTHEKYLLSKNYVLLYIMCMRLSLHHHIKYCPREINHFYS